jgi:UDP-N-acetylmuramoylalanine--D-glutamate ligase
LAGIDPATVAPAVESFRGLPHRLHRLGERDEITWVDDSISTTPQSARAAVEAFPGRPITLLLGGHDRGLDYTELARFVVARPVETVITLPDSGPRVAAAIRQACSEAETALRLIEAADLADAVHQAREATPAGGVVLLSPAAPSFGRFRDYRQRGDWFAELAGLLG